MTPTIPTVQYLPRPLIEIEARRVLQRWAMSSLPVDPLAIAHREGIAVYTVTFLDASLSGSISKEPTGTTIRVSRGDPPSRRRFTIAHELGHYYLHMAGGRETPGGETLGGETPGGDIRQFTDGTENLFRQPSRVRQPASDGTRREYQANLFAAALLMPEDRVLAYWQAYDSIAELARVFEVSELAMSIRLGQLGLLDDPPA